jgi:DNA-directed RNA polymerase specialized sigma24 family protein
VAEAAGLAGWSQTMVKVQAYRARQKFEKLYRKMNAPASGD